MAYANTFRQEDTETGSFRSYSHGWNGDTAIMAAVHRLMNNEPDHVVELHICDHHLTNNRTHKVVRCWVDGRGPNAIVRYSGTYEGSKLAEVNSAHIACKLAMVLMRDLKEDQCIFLQPTEEQRKELE